MLVWLLGFIFGGCMAPKQTHQGEPTADATKVPHVLFIDSFLLTAPYGTIYVSSRGKVFITIDEATGKMKEIGTLTPDGQMIATGGRVVASISETGALSGSDGKPSGGVISDTGVLLYQDKMIQISADGTIVGTNPEVPTIYAVGIDANQHKTALFLLFSIIWEASPEGETQTN